MSALDAAFQTARARVNAEARSLRAADPRTRDYARRYEAFTALRARAESLRARRDELRARLSDRT